MKRLDPAQTRLHARAMKRPKPARKLLDLSLIALLGGLALPAFAQDAATTPPQSLACGDVEDAHFLIAPSRGDALAVA